MKILRLGIGTFVSLCLALIAYNALAARYERIALKEALRNDLNVVLKHTSELHEASVKQDNHKVGQAAKKLITAIEKSERKSGLAGVNTPHLLKILRAAKKNLEMFRNQSGEARKGSLQEAFRSLVQLEKVYKLDDYKIFFCGKDRAVWLQKSGKPQHPIQPVKLKGCGVQVIS